MPRGDKQYNMAWNINLPSLDVQVKIAAQLSEIDDKIAINRRICENLEAQAQALFKHWFIDFAPFKNGKFVESELGMIPEGWRVGRLDELGDIVGGATPSKAEDSYYTSKGIAWLTPKDLSNKLSKFTSRGEIDLTQEGYNSCSAKLMPKGSVLFSSRAPIGYLTIAKNDICTNQGFKSVVPKYAGTAYIYYLLKTNTKRIESMSSGTTFKEASGSLMRSLAVIIPPKSIIDNYEASVVEIFNEQEVIEDESTRLAELRDTLLPKLMSGQIKV
jgi:type I restriction enzyme S subunit